MVGRLRNVTLAALAALIGFGHDVLAAGKAEPWQINLQDAASPVMERVHDFHNFLLIIITAIVLLVLGLMAYIIFRFNAKRNPVPSKTTHNTLLEVVWTGVPIIILVIIAIPSMKLLYFHDRAQEYDMTLKVTGHQWYWTYSYPDHGDFSFGSFLMPDEMLEEGQPRLLTVDEPVVLPVDTTVQLLLTSNDVIHNWAVPALGVKIDTTPGRINERWVRVTKEGKYYGMCSELCGVNHGFMPIEIHAVSKEEFAQWVDEAQEKFAAADRPDREVARAEAAR